MRASHSSIVDAGDTPLEDAGAAPEGARTPPADGPGPVEGADRPRAPMRGGRALVIGPAVAAVAIAVAVILLLSSIPGVERTAWAYEMTQLDMAYDLDLRGEGVRVGIVDTGVDTGHPALEGARVVAWKDLVKGRGSPYDEDGHGTSMASIIAAQGELRGGAPRVELIVVRVIGDDGMADDRRIADGIDFCLDPDGDGSYSDGADIISLSLGGKLERLAQLIGSRTRDAVTQAVQNGVLVVAAAGNDGGPGDDGDVATPGVLQQVVCVGAVDRNGRVAAFSSSGTKALWTAPNEKPEVVAPGVEIATAYSDDRYAVGSGTSHATAFVTAVLAAALSGTPRLLHDGAEGGDLDAVRLVKEALMTTALEVEGQQTPHDDRAGYGIVQARALAATLGTAHP